MQNSYFPATYQPYYQYQQPSYQPQIANYQTQANGSGITWVDGLSSARAYPIANGTSILLMDSNESAFYIKSADQSGMPSLRIFEYKERTMAPSNTPPQVAQAPQIQEQVPVVKESTEEKIDMSIFVTKDELCQAKKDIEDKIESLVPSSTSIISAPVQKGNSKK